MLLVSLAPAPLAFTIGILIYHSELKILFETFHEGFVFAQSHLPGTQLYALTNIAKQTNRFFNEHFLSLAAKVCVYEQSTEDILGH